MSNQKTIYWMIPVLLLMVMACEPQITSAPDTGVPPVSENVTFEYEYNSENPNIVHFTSTSEGFKFLWDLGNGQTAEGETVNGEYPLQGEYIVQLTVFTKAGQAKNTKNVIIESTNGLMLEDPDLDLITGGTANLDGKTWVIDSTQTGHMGVGPTTGRTPEWWAAAPNSKPGTGLYNDEYTFSLDGFTFDMETNGDVFLAGNNASDFSGAYDAPGGDMMASWTAPDDLTFNFIKNDDGSMFLTVADPGFIGFYTGVHTYEILELTENLMVLRFEDSNDDLVWYHRLIPKGYEHPVVVPPLKSEALADDFDTDGNITWATDQIAEFNESYDNPATFGANTSAKVAKYVKGDGQAHSFDNLYIDLGYRLDLTQRSTISLKVYLPSYNDYTTSGGEPWNPNPVLLKQVSVKLQDASLGGDAWTTQEERIQPVSVTDEWVELTFDFSDVIDRQDFSKIVVQIGGEAHFNPGTFFMDDFLLIE